MKNTSQGNQRSRHLRCAVVLLSTLCAIFTNPAVASRTRVIYSFGGNDGEYFDTELAIDQSGNLYGTSVEGGDFQAGNVFQLVPGAHGWSLRVIYSFTGGTDGAQPYKGVTIGPDGDLYGTTVTGGSGGCEGGCGVVYKITHNHGSWSQSVIYTFTGGKDGSAPGSPVAFDAHGNLFGATPTGGAFGVGTVYELKRTQSGAWKFALLHTFTGGRDGAGGSAGRLLIGDQGVLYGVATGGGIHGSGTAYRLTPTQHGKWKMETLYAFKGVPDAGSPYGGLVSDPAGNLYGTSYYDGASNLGAIYELSPAGSKWKEKLLHSFEGGADGKESLSTLVSDAAGNLYGTTVEGGSGCDCGTTFKLAAGTRHYSVAYRFKGSPDGEYLYAGMAPDSTGQFYGITLEGGKSGVGTIFRFIP